MRVATVTISNQESKVNKRIQNHNILKTQSPHAHWIDLSCLVLIAVNLNRFS